MNRAFWALLAGGVAYLLTREPVAGLLVAAGVWLFARPKRVGQGSSLEPPPRTFRDRHGGIEVVCKQVTAERQEWASVKTGRLYDVLAPNGPANARPGDRAYVVTTPTGYRIVETSAEREKVG